MQKRDGKGCNAFYLYDHTPSGEEHCIACLGDGVDSFIDGVLDLPEYVLEDAYNVRFVEE